MKKNGFTLAEVLITLAIIGVVATLTLPALMTNTGEQQAKTALKKGINTLTEAAQMHSAISGYDYSSLTEDSTSDPESQSLYGLLATRGSIDFRKSGMMDKLGDYTSHQGTQDGVNSNYALFFRDGSALLFPDDVTSTGTTEQSTAGLDMQDDNLVYGISLIYDTNGIKGPNILSNCDGNSLGVADDKQAAAKDGEYVDVKTLCTPDKRVIKDQFGVRLRGSYVVPNGRAARWAFEN